MDQVAANWTADCTSWAPGTEGVARYEGEPTSRGGPDNSGPENRRVTPPGDEGVENANLAIAAFWEVLKEAGYDV